MLTAAQEAWVLGFMAFFAEEPRPRKVGPKQAGWDAAEATQWRGGYG